MNRAKLSVVVCVTAVVLPASPSTAQTRDVSVGDLSEEKSSAYKNVEIESRLGAGRSLLIVQWRGDGGEIKRPLRVVGTKGGERTVAANGRRQSIKVEASFPSATRLKIGNDEIFAVFRERRPIYFVSDMCAGWALLSENIDPRMGKSPNVVCRRVAEACPQGFVRAGDGPLYRDQRCPDAPSANSETAKICYRPGRLRFYSDVAQSIELRYPLTGASETLKLEAGRPSEFKPFEYERCRPQSVRIGARSYFFAVGAGEDWVVSITQGGVTAKIERSETPPPARGP